MATKIQKLFSGGSQGSCSERSLSRETAPSCSHHANWWQYQHPPSGASGCSHHSNWRQYQHITYKDFNGDSCSHHSNWRQYQPMFCMVSSIKYLRVFSGTFTIFMAWFGGHTRHISILKLFTFYSLAKVSEGLL